jgi:hypothetical protein
MTRHATFRAITRARTHVWTVAGARIRALIRTRVVFAALALALLPWFAATDHDVDGELALLTSSALIGLLATASGVVAESLDDGWYAISVLHGLTPLELLLGEALGALVGLIPVTVGLVALSAPAFRAVPIDALAVCAIWLIVLVLGWLAIMLFLGTLLPGKGNAVAMIPLLVAFAFPSALLPVDSWPSNLARLARAAWDTMPLESHARALYAAQLHGSRPTPAAPMALLVAPPAFLALAALRLSRLDAARRLTA